MTNVHLNATLNLMLTRTLITAAATANQWGEHRDNQLAITATATSRGDQNFEAIEKHIRDGHQAAVDFRLGGRLVCSVVVSTGWAQPGFDHSLRVAMSWGEIGSVRSDIAARFATVVATASALTGTLQAMIEAAS